MTKKPDVIKIVVSPQQRIEIEDAAAERRLSISAYARQAMGVESGKRPKRDRQPVVTYNFNSAGNPQMLIDGKIACQYGTHNEPAVQMVTRWLELQARPEREASERVTVIDTLKGMDKEQEG
jgi:hypothetical protein